MLAIWSSVFNLRTWLESALDTFKTFSTDAIINKLAIIYVCDMAAKLVRFGIVSY